jgi:hypothetical protein
MHIAWRISIPSPNATQGAAASSTRSSTRQDPESNPGGHLTEWRYSENLPVKILNDAHLKQKERKYAPSGCSVPWEKDQKIKRALHTDLPQVEHGLLHAPQCLVLDTPC